ncbi:terminase small subunit [Phaeobacter inhibens]|uniref:terminase small subunit n=1 Tax=Phaeobacter inhibens TaxID=221822 RepID=UPI0018F65EB6
MDRCTAQAAIRAGYSERTAEQQGYQLLQKTSVMEAVREAAIRAGYSAKTVHSVGHENLKKPEIQDTIHEAPLYCQKLTFKLRSKRPNRSVRTGQKSPKTGCCGNWRADLNYNQKEINLPGLCGAVARLFFGNSRRNIEHRYGGNLVTHFRTSGTPKSRLIPGGSVRLPAASGA